MLKDFLDDMNRPVAEPGQGSGLSARIARDLTAPIGRGQSGDGLGKILRELDQPLAVPSNEPGLVRTEVNKVVLDLMLPAGFKVAENGQVVRVEGARGQSNTFMSMVTSLTGDTLVPEAAQTVAEAAVGLLHDLNSPITRRLSVEEVEARDELSKKRIESVKNAGRLVGRGASFVAKEGLNVAKKAAGGISVFAAGASDYISRKVAERRNRPGGERKSQEQPKIIDLKFNKD